MQGTEQRLILEQAGQAPCMRLRAADTVGTDEAWTVPPCLPSTVATSKGDCGSHGRGCDPSYDGLRARHSTYHVPHPVVVILGGWMGVQGISWQAISGLRQE